MVKYNVVIYCTYVLVFGSNKEHSSSSISSAKTMVRHVLNDYTLSRYVFAHGKFKFSHYSEIVLCNHNQNRSEILL